MLNKIRIAILVICLGISAGLGAHYLLNKEDGKLVSRHLRFDIPEGGVKTDAFSLRIFRAEVERNQHASVIISPALLSQALKELREMAESTIQQDIDKQQLYPAVVQHTTSPTQALLFATDFELNYQDSTQDYPLMRLPFSNNLPMAMELFNSTLVHTTDLPQEAIAKGKAITKDSRFVIGMATAFTPEFQIPFLSAHSTVMGFENDNGSIPQVTALKTRGQFRYARDIDGKWEAIALPLQPDVSYEYIPTVFIGILPTGKAKKLALELTPEELSRIRQSLLEATPADYSVSLPQMVWNPPMRDMRPLLSNIGLEKLLDSTTDNWKFVNQALGIDVLVEKLSLSLVSHVGAAGQIPTPEQAAAEISFNRPFIWLIGDLTTAAPPYFMGMVQNL